MTAISPTIVWTALLLLGVGGATHASRPRLSRATLGSGWALFGVFWATMAPHYFYAKDSFIEGALCVAALPIGLYVGYVTYTRGVESFATLGRAVAVMGIIYLPVEQIPALRRAAIELVTVQTVGIVETLFGHSLRIQEGPIYGYQSGIAAPNAPGGLLLSHIELACTGLGSIAIVVGIIAVLDEPAYQRALAAVVAASFIYVLNLVRTVFITAAYVGQWFQFYVPEVLAFTGYTDPRIASFFIADKVISQSLSVMVLLGLFVVGLRVFPSLSGLVREVVGVMPTRR